MAATSASVCFFMKYELQHRPGCSDTHLPYLAKLVCASALPRLFVYASSFFSRACAEMCAYY